MKINKDMKDAPFSTLKTLPAGSWKYQTLLNSAPMGSQTFIKMTNAYERCHLDNVICSYSYKSNFKGSHAATAFLDGKVFKLYERRMANGHYLKH